MVHIDFESLRRIDALLCAVEVYKDDEEGVELAETLLRIAIEEHEKLGKHLAEIGCKLGKE